MASTDGQMEPGDIVVLRFKKLFEHYLVGELVEEEGELRFTYRDNDRSRDAALAKACKLVPEGRQVWVFDKADNSYDEHVCRPESAS